MAAELQQFFKFCDRDGTRSVDRDAFRDLCVRLNISTEDADVIFEHLDHDCDGRISFSDFSEGFSSFLSSADVCNDELQNEEVASALNGENRCDLTKHHVWTTLTSEAERVGEKKSDEGKLKWLLHELQMSDQRHLVPYLESAVEELLGNLKQLQEEKAKLENSWKREKLEHEKHLKRMEEELDQQVKEAEFKLRLKAQEQVEDERKCLQTKMDSEMDKLQTHLVLMEKVYSWLRTQPAQQRDVRLDEVRTKLDEAVHDNRQLRMSLLDTQTSIALMRGELLQLRTLYEEKCRELSNERERVLEVLQEQDQLSRQLNLLQDANKRLLDSHDVLRNSVVETAGRQGSMKRAKSGSVIGDYLDHAVPYDILSRFEETDCEDEYSICRPSVDRTRRRSKSKDGQLATQSLNHSDSGVSSSVREVDDGHQSSDGEVEYAQPRRDRYRRGSEQSRISRAISMPPPHSEMVLNENQRDMKCSTSQDSLCPSDTIPRKRISDIKKQLGIEDKPASWNRSLSPNPLQCSTPRDRFQESSNFAPVPLPRMSKINSIYESIDHDDDLSDACPSDYNSTSVEVENLYEPSGPPEHTFKVIFVGDAGVGKSSFALRISKGVFVRHMSSTLGLDFLMRTLRVDGRNIAVQLWDTAGQERFRSITKTYFRKADGVMLLYDCTCEHSFLNVRQWVEDIDVSCFYSMMAEKPSSSGTSSTKRLPLMIVANKTDLRDTAHKNGHSCISTEQGKKLAKDCDTTFMEASAKDGSNVLHALANLIRSMTTQQELHVSQSTMQLCDTKPKKSGCCGK